MKAQHHLHMSKLVVIVLLASLQDDDQGVTTDFLH
jgi:hypothetical protein